jgi:hypothetical protein
MKLTPIGAVIVAAILFLVAYRAKHWSLGDLVGAGWWMLLGIPVLIYMIVAFGAALHMFFPDDARPEARLPRFAEDEDEDEDEDEQSVFDIDPLRQLREL